MPTDRLTFVEELPVCYYRKDAKGKRDSLCPRQIDRASAKRYSPRVAEIVLAANAVNHKSSEASATTHFQLQATRICARARSAEKLGTINCDVVALARIRAPSASVCE